ncbi:hypothetical protein [Xylanimonas sp. McL0601]|uniref:hypothetical protein n=1 Tax=Xylanimonas sp. McL0601 TaxID=3414739 RepID=UPI003CF05D8B
MWSDVADDRVGELVRSVKVKLDGSRKSHTARVARTGPEGIWLFSPAGTEIIGSDGSLTTQPADGVQYFPRHVLPETGGRFVAWCWAAAPEPPADFWSSPWISVDIAASRDEPFSFLDLELDLWCSSDGSGIVDVEELDAAERAGWVDAAGATRARGSADEVQRELKVGYQDAFGRVGWNLLAQVRGRPAHEA